MSIEIITIKEKADEFKQISQYTQLSKSTFIKGVNIGGMITIPNILYENIGNTGRAIISENIIE